MKTTHLTLVLISLGLSACGHVTRHENSGYANRNAYTQSHAANSFYQEQKNQVELESRQELGLQQELALSESERSRLSARMQLKRLEEQLINENARRQYYHYKPLMTHDLERIEFLSLPNMVARERWAQNRNLDMRRDNFDPGTLTLIENNDIGLGMNQQAVRESWGDPDRVDVAGNEIYGNQAWRYSKMVSGGDGYKKETRVIYFESGRVVGWESY